MVTMTTLHAVCLIACLHLSAGQASRTPAAPGDCVSVSVDLHTASPYTLESSVNYPQPYASNVCMQWTLTAPPGRCTVVKVKGGFFTETKFDFVEITEASGRSRRYEGAAHDRTDEILFFTHGSSTSVKFNSDHSVEKTGFQLSVELTGCEAALVENTIAPQRVSDQVVGCVDSRKTLTPNSLYVMATTNYPRNYPNNHCQDWFVSAPEGKCTLIKVYQDFSLEPMVDHLTIMSENQRTRKYYSDHPDGEVLFFTSGRHTNIYFTTDGFVTRPGFLLSAQLVDCEPAIAENTVDGVPVTTK